MISKFVEESNEKLFLDCKEQYDGEHLTARFSVSTGVKKENSMRIKVRKNIKRIIEVYPSKYFIAKFASK